ncbi:F-box/kelch-repeat protein At3g06240-like [Cornus florida]|uniref:F-box/kelch-repeat protein At3g06240-like n=1 Tax=Cornus florida TaxID=4283 RepID=UPI002896EEBF|nr:F-box/kelch-repeat protein At3g06240-like [Cornus florida]
MVGFGYDHCSDDYKLVKITRHSIYVYSVINDSWRKVEDIGIHVMDHTTQLNGAIHWLYFPLDSDSDYTSEIAAFSLADEKLRKIPLPTSFTDRHCQLLVFEGCLCVLPVPLHDALWVMKEYGVYKSWTKLDIKVPFRNTMEPLGLLGNDEALLLDHTILVLYNARERTCRAVTYRTKNITYSDVVKSDIHEIEIFHATIYVDSLVSLYRGKQLEFRRIDV